ncbi:MAG: hypothetical protein JW820_09435 [Spirochaetales bacterium]|nr:hypothetical protein [Spirochaetales bacterium]
MYRGLPGGLRPLRTARGLQFALHDLDGDSQPECFAAAAATKGMSDAELQQLGDPSRLFEEDAQSAAFSLVLFTSRGGALEPLGVVSLGDHLVFEQLRATPVGPGETGPLILTAGFLTPEGKQHELLVFDDLSGKPRHRRTLSETLSNRFQLRDIDGDGIQDLVLFERAMEEGTGYETFLSWYRWDGRGFREHRTTNVVRNLKSFLDRLQEQLLERRLSELLSKSIHPDALERLREREPSTEAAILEALGLEPAELPRLPEAREIIYPPILENPFASADSLGWFFELSFRIVDSAGISYIASTRVYMLANPFGERQFALVPSVR